MTKKDNNNNKKQANNDGQNTTQTRHYTDKTLHRQNTTKKVYNTESKKVFLIIETSKLQPSYRIDSFNLIQTCHLCGDNKNHKIRNYFYL